MYNFPEIAPGTIVTGTPTLSNRKYTGRVITQHRNDDGTLNGVTRIVVTDPGETGWKVGSEWDTATMRLTPVA